MTNCRRSAAARSAAIASAVLLLASRAGAVTSIWIDPNDPAGTGTDANAAAHLNGNFNTASHWNSGVPGFSDNANFNAPGYPATPYTVSFTQNNTVNQIDVSNPVTFNLAGFNLFANQLPANFNDTSLFVANHGNLTLSNGLLIAQSIQVGSNTGSANGTASITIDGTAGAANLYTGIGSQVANYQQINVKAGGALVLSNSTFVNQAPDLSSGGTNTGQIVLTGPSSGLYVGDGATISGGEFHVNDGFVAPTGSSLTYDSLLYDGELFVDLANVTVNLTSSLTDPHNANAIIPTTVTTDINASQGFLNISGAVVQVTPDNGVHWNPFLTAGSVHTTIQNALLTTGNMYLDGDPAPAAGSVTTIDPSLVNVHGDLVVGNFGVASLAVNNGANVINIDGALIVGDRPTGNGTLTIDGQAAISTSANVTNSTYGFGEIIVGKQGTGSMTLSGGAHAAVGGGYAAWIGQNDNGNGTGGNGTLTVTGAATSANTTFQSTLSVPSNNLFVASDRHTSGTLNITNGGFVSDASGVIALSTGSLGAVIVDGSFTNPNSGISAASQWLNTGDLYVGQGGAGSLIARNGAVVDDPVGRIAANTGSAGTVLLDNATWNNSSFLLIGDHGAANLTLQNGATLLASSAAMANSSDGSANATIDHAAWNNSSFLTVGSAGNATLTIQNAGSVTNTSGSVAFAAGSTSSVTISGALSNWTNASFLTVGYGGNGTLSVNSNASLSTGADLQIGGLANSSGKVFADHATLTVQSFMIVGSAGAGAFQLHNSAHANITQSLSAASSSSSTAAILLDGSGTLLSVGTFSTIGGSGNASLTVQNGAHLTNASSLTIGDQSTAHGAVTLDGPGTLLSAASFVSVGSIGVGNLSIQNAATFTDSGSAFLGANAGGNGTALITGNNSLWSIANGLFIGSAGNGTLTIQNHAAVAVSGASTFLGGSANSTGSLLVTGSGSQLTNALQFAVAVDGNATMTLSAGALVTCAPGASPSGTAGFVGEEGTGVGTLTITDPGSQLLASGNFNVGSGNNGASTTSGGTGTLFLNNGALLASTNGYVGRWAGSVGTVSLSGANAAWQNSGNFFIAANDPANNPGNQTLAPGTGNVTINTAASISAAASALIGPAGTLTLAGGTLTSPTTANNGLLRGNGTITGNLTNNATLSITAPATINLSGSYTQNANATLSGNGTLIVKALFGNLGTIAGTVQIRANGTNSSTSNLNSLSLAGNTSNWTGALDITNNKLVLQPAPASKSTTLATLRNQVAFGNSHPAGIFSSTHPANFALALLDNAVTQFSTFGGQPVDSNSLLLSQELLGDANADGHVDLTDLSTILNNFGATTPNWTSGNFDNASTIDLTDLSDVLNNFGLTFANANSSHATFGAAIATPEPASLAVMLPVSAFLLLRKRRAAR